MIPIAIQLLHLHLDQDELQEAGHLIERVREAAEGAGDTLLRAAYFDALADLHHADLVMIWANASPQLWQKYPPWLCIGPPIAVS